jgi:hypothetical protein
MFWPRNFNVLHLIPLACLLFSVRAFAQFEVAPDHFDSSPTQPVHRSAVKSKPTTGLSKTMPGSVRNGHTSPAMNQRKKSNGQYARRAVQPQGTGEAGKHVSSAKATATSNEKPDAAPTVALKPVESSPSIHHRE